MMSLVAGIDISTTATKVLLMDKSGAVVSAGVSEYGYESPHPLWAEQDPHLWWTATEKALSAALAGAGGSSGNQIEGIGLTGQMHGSVLLDEAGEVIRPAILWNDQRTAPECDEIRQAVGRQTLIATTGNDALTGFTAPKLRWVARHEPDNWKKVAKFLLPKDYVRYRLTSGFAVDVADGSGTILFDLAERTWSTPLLETLSIDPAICPSTHEGPEVTGVLGEPSATVLGLHSGTPVVAGGGDQAANAVGLGAIEDGVVALSLGTSGVVFASSDEPAIDPEGRVHAFCHAVPGRWHMMGVMLSAAGSLRWLRDTVAPGRPFEELVAAAETVPAGCDGLIFLPYLSGERTPHPDPLARGAFIGLTTRHGLGHLTRAVLEGVAFGLRDGLDLMVAAGVERPSEIRASGGGTRSELWCQILSDVLGSRIVKVGTDEGAAYGAGLLAAVGAGWFQSADEAVAASVTTVLVSEPSQSSDRYAEIHSLYADLYPMLSPTFSALASIES